MASVNGSLQVPRAAESSKLPDCASNTLELVSATPQEALDCVLINSNSWSGPLTPEAYIRREQHLAKTELSRSGGLTTWVLVDSADKSHPRTILSACETLRKRALVAHRDGSVEHVVSHGIGSVFCRNEYRGRGYAGRMMRELGRRLEGWQQENGNRAQFNVLYSDIGKQFYTKNGWIPFPSSHISLAPSQDNSEVLTLPEPIPIHDKDLEWLCTNDELILRKIITQFDHMSPERKVAFIPDAATMRWHHAREEFVAQDILQRQPKIKGALVKVAAGTHVWCIWTRVFSRKENENTLYILRIVVEGEEDSFKALSKLTDENGMNNGRLLTEQHVCAVAACLRAAKKEAAEWGMHRVEIWNPSSTVIAGSRLLEPGAEIINRDTESIASLMWYGSSNASKEIEWVKNEKYAWC